MTKLSNVLEEGLLALLLVLELQPPLELLEALLKLLIRLALLLSISLVVVVPLFCEQWHEQVSITSYDLTYFLCPKTFPLHSPFFYKGYTSYKYSNKPLQTLLHHSRDSAPL